MIKPLLICNMLVSVYAIQAQTLYVPEANETVAGLYKSIVGGKVGIGLNNPNSLLHIYSGKSVAHYSSYEKAVIESNDHTQLDILSGANKESSIYLKSSNSSNGQTFGGIAYFNENTTSYGLSFYSGNTIRMRILETGSVGIGTVAPKGLLHVYQGKSVANYSTYARSIIESNDHSQLDVLSGANKESSIYLKTTKNSGDQSYGGVAYYNENTADYGLAFYSGNSIRMRILENGNVGIGTSSPQNKLDVNGTIHAKEVKVDLTAWSDFVFHPSYQLKSLAEVEQYIKTNGHLEHIPSAEEVMKNGVNMGEMQTKLLQKIEELTLYTIEQNKKLEDQAKINAMLLEKIQQIEKQIPQKQ